MGCTVESLVLCVVFCRNLLWIRTVESLVLCVVFCRNLLWVRTVESLVLCVVFCRSLFTLFVWPFLGQFTGSDTDLASSNFVYMTSTFTLAKNGKDLLV